MPGTYRSASIHAKDGEKEPNSMFVFPPKLGDSPPTASELTAPLYHSLLLQSPSLRSYCTLM